MQIMHKCPNKNVMARIATLKINLFFVDLTSFLHIKMIKANNMRIKFYINDFKNILEKWYKNEREIKPEKIYIFHFFKKFEKS